ncbi:GNAT family N-acetyltransferase [Paenibacillus sp. L3-i20]|uniref:GNAT family N-acetyltransferase n=1 Tax=Paenibacillus sp. L3-i20 TaxID=2905833 RepID=UPI001EDF640B|nr:GNAT family N-acetyltransferase [Paenibacillus sp. L3-i20]
MVSDIADKLELSEITFQTDRMTAIEQLVGNPHGIEIVKFGRAVAFYSRMMPWPVFNNVKGWLEAKYVDDIITFYEERKRSFEFQITPFYTKPDVMSKLARSGYHQSGFHSTMYTEAVETTEALESDLHIRELREDEFMDYAAIHCIGNGLSQDSITYVAANNQIMFNRPGWKYFIAFIGDQPAATAVMYVKDRIASFTFAATLPQFRNLGLHSGLLRRRIHAAYMEGCQLVVAQCAYRSISQSNMERAGMRIGYTRATWTKL